MITVADLDLNYQTCVCLNLCFETLSVVLILTDINIKSHLRLAMVTLFYISVILGFVESCQLMVCIVE